MDASSAGRTGGSQGVPPVLQQCRMKRSGDDDVTMELTARGGTKKRAALGTLTNTNASSAVQLSNAAPAECEPTASLQPPIRRITRSVSASMARKSMPLEPKAEAQMDVEEEAAQPAQLEVAEYTDIDKGQTDPTVVVDYVDEIYTYLRDLESKFRPKSGYMRKQRDINHGMRTILVDWLVEVAEEYKLNTHTLFIAVGYIDRFLSEMSVQRGKLQLVGVTSMLLASKYEEIYPPAVDEFVYITDNTYSREQILKMENLVLKVLQFDMGAVTAHSFAERFLNAAAADEKTRFLAQYLMELTLQDGERYLKYRPSVVAAASICVALHTLALPHWSATLQHYTELSPADISDCVRDVYYTFVHAPDESQQAVREKYACPKFQRVSKIGHLDDPPPL